MRRDTVVMFFTKYWHVFFIGVVWLLFIHPYFLKGLVPYPSSYQVNFFSPWSAYEQNWGPVKNNAMPDVINQIYPWKFLTISQYKLQELPSWNPYNFAGNPHIANYQTAAFSPFNLLYHFLPFIDAWSIIVLLQPLIAAIGTYLFVREIQLSKHAGVFSSVTFMFCGFLVVWMAYGTLSMSVAFLPLILYGIERCFRRFSVPAGCIVAGSIAISFFSGHFQTSLYVALCSFGYILFKGIVAKKNKKLWLSVFAFYTLGVGIALIQIIPAIQLYLYSSRSDIFLSPGNGIPWYYLVTLFAPDFFGNPVTRNDWFGYYAEWASFIGIVPLFLALLAVFYRGNKQILFFLILAFLSLALAIESPIYQLFVFLKIPVLGTSTPSRIIVLFSFSLAVLAGFGFDSLHKLLAEKRKKTIVMVVGILAALVALLWVLILFFQVLPPEKVDIARRNMFLPTVLFIIIASFSLFFTLAKSKKLLTVFLFLILILASTDNIRYAAKWMPFDSRTFVFPEIPVIDAMKKHIGNGRVFGNIGTEVESYYGLGSIDGYDPLYINRYGEFIRTADTGQYMAPERSVVRLSRRGIYTDRVLDFLGVSLIFHPIADTNQGWAYPVWEKNERYDLVYQDDKFQLFKNKQALSRATMFYDFQIEKDARKLLMRFYEDTFSFKETLLLEEDPGVKPISHAEEGTTQFLIDTPQRIVIKTSSKSDALLFLADNYYPTWSAKVNGKHVKILRANYTFRAVVVPGGESVVEFTSSVI